MADSPKIQLKPPQLNLAEKTLKKSLLQSLHHIFSLGVHGCVLAGGTALAGFYACHRRSDDLDLFTQDEKSQTATVLAIESLASLGVIFHEPYKTQQYFHTTCQLKDHRFTITCVKDPNLFRVGKTITLKNGICIVDLHTLLKMKAATLVSRCSEKDLFDLIWLFNEFKEVAISNLIQLGNEIDAGVNGESMILSISGAILRKEACDFSLDQKLTKETVFKKILEFQKKLIIDLHRYLESEPAPSLRKLVRKITKLAR